MKLSGIVPSRGGSSAAGQRLLRLVFGRDAPSAEVVDCSSGFCIEGGILRERPSGPAIATQRNHRWRVRGGTEHVRIDCEGPLTLRFEHRDGATSEVFGPHRHFSVVDGAIYLDHRPLARFQDGTGVWCCEPRGQGWPLVVVEQA